jgi:hypothetical protein
LFPEPNRFLAKGFRPFFSLITEFVNEPGEFFPMLNSVFFSTFPQDFEWFRVKMNEYCIVKGYPGWTKKLKDDIAKEHVAYIYLSPLHKISDKTAIAAISQ